MAESGEPVPAPVSWRLRLEVDDPNAVVAVGVSADNEELGFASGGPTRDADGPGWELYAVNVVAAVRGTGLAHELVGAVVGDRPCAVWVLVDNARARAFYARDGWVTEGVTRPHEGSGAPEVRMVRPARSVAD